MKDILSKHGPILVAGTLSAIAYAYLSLHSQHYADANLAQLLSVSVVCGMLCFISWLHYWRSHEEIPLISMIGFAILFRIIAVTGFPILEDDIYRYLWDGRLTIELGSPYGHIPANFFPADNLSQQFESILGAINYPYVATIYGPVCQWVFAGAYLIAPGEIWPLQCFFALADIALILTLLKLAKPLYVMLYAWSPLIIKEFSFTAHPDVLGALFLIAAYLAYQHKRFVLLGILLALATGVKIFALMLVPLLLGFQARAWLAFMLTAVLIALPWGVTEAWFPAGLKQMGNSWLFNAPIYFLLKSWAPIQTIKLILLSMLAVISAIYYVYAMKNWQLTKIRGDIMFAALFICAPVFNAWYLVWLLPFAVIYPSFWAWTASVSVFLAYVSGINLNGTGLYETTLEPYQQPMWAIVLEFSTIAVAAFLQPILKRVLQTR